MTTNCPNCNKPLKGKENEALLCYSCGSVIFKKEIIQIGLAKYKFKDDSTDYISVFESEQDKDEFLGIATKNSDDYKYCKVITPTGIITIV